MMLIGGILYHKEYQTMGIILLNLHKQQQCIWHNKYNNMIDTPYPISWSQFNWLMKVMQCRAYVSVKDNYDNIATTI